MVYYAGSSKVYIISKNIFFFETSCYLEVQPDTLNFVYMLLSQVPWANGLSHSFSHLSHLIHQLWIKLFWKNALVLCRHTFPG